MNGEACSTLNNIFNFIKAFVDKDNKVIKVLPMLRRPERNLRSFCLPSLDYTDKTSWYQNSISVTKQPLMHMTAESSSESNMHVFNAPEGHAPMINIWHMNLTYPTLYYRSYVDGTVSFGGIPQSNGTYKMHAEYEIAVYLNNELLSPSKYIVDFKAGKIVTNGVVFDPMSDMLSASYHYVNPINGSEFIIRPKDNNYTWDLKHTEIQVSAGCASPMPFIMFEIWAGNENFEYDFNDPRTGLVYAIPYRGPGDFMNIGNEGKGSINGFGGYRETLVFPFNYSTTIQLGKTFDGQGMLIRAYIKDDAVIENADIATIAYYLEEFPYDNQIF